MRNSIFKVHIMALLISSALLSACIAPPEKEENQSAEEKIFLFDDDNSSTGNGAQVIGFSEDGDIPNVDTEEPSLVTSTSRTEQTTATNNALLKGLQSMEGHMASLEELHQGRKNLKNIQTFTKLGLQPTIYFSFNQAELNEASKQVLLSYAKLYTEQVTSGTFSKVILTLEGHTDYKGTTGYNLSLGLRRALSVERFLHRQGVPSDNVEVESYGEERRIFEELEEEYQRYNRRVEIYFNISKLQQ